MTPPRKPPARRRVRGTRSAAGILASAPQDCALDCGRPISPGDAIVRTRRGYAHAACVSARHGDVPLPFDQPEDLTPEEEARRLRRALVDVLAHVNGEPATPEDRRDHGIARAAAKWTRILV